MLLNELSTLRGDNVLVLDDYHLLNAADIHEDMEFFLTYVPPALRIILSTRVDPPLPLARMRARGELAELRAVDLSFSVDEAATLLRGVGNAPLDDRATLLLWERTEGWAAGLQLAALSLRGTARPSAAARAIHGDDRHILDYLSAEVLDRLSPDQRHLLVRTSVLERLSGPLCDEVLGTHGSATILEQLDRADLFVVPLDSRHEWYRCHRLFRDALRQEQTDEAETVRVRCGRRIGSWPAIMSGRRSSCASAPAMGRGPRSCCDPRCRGSWSGVLCPDRLSGSTNTVPSIISIWSPCGNFRNRAGALMSR